MMAVDVDIEIGIDRSMLSMLSIDVASEVGVTPRCSTLVHLPAREHALHEHEGNRVEAGPINRVAAWQMRRN